MKNDPRCIKEDVCDMAVCDGVMHCSHAVRKSAVLAQQTNNSAITPPEERDCDTCANDGECYVTVLKCKGYVRAAQ